MTPYEAHVLKLMEERGIDTSALEFASEPTVLPVRKPVKRMTEEDRIAALEMRRAGKTLKAIGEALGVSKECVRIHLRDMEERCAAT